ncbi:MAG: hypothetical protein HYT08_04085 [Candidatus Levybacteria bacterium]|nr:hypothetical protein [Candidatus Levybacteria bacterium]
MFGKFTYLFYTLSITLPLIIITWFYYWPILKKAIKLISLLVILLTIYGSIMMTVALRVKAWSYSTDKILEIRLLGVAIEDTIWWALILTLIISCAIVMIKKQDHKEPILKRS